MKTIGAGLRRIVRVGAATAGIGAATLASAQLTLYEHDNFQGSSFLVNADTENFAPLGFNDRVSSAEVRAGTWQLCEDAGYRGQCVTLTPGRHGSLRAVGMNDRVSSVRRVADGAVGAVGNGGGAIELFEHDNFQGRRFAAGENTANLAPLGFNDTASSISVSGGQWQLCEDADYRGRCITLGPGRHASLNALGFNDRVSSLRRVDEVPPAGGAAAIELYEHDDFGGRALRAAGAMPNLQMSGFNDLASSVQVRSGRWELCSDAEYRGRCIALEPGSVRRLRERDMNDMVSSLRPLAAAPGLPPPGSAQPGGPTIQRSQFNTWRVVFGDGCIVHYNSEGRRTASEPSCTPEHNAQADRVIVQRPAR